MHGGDTVSASYATGAVQARSRAGANVERAGGLVGTLGGTVEASYSRGAVTISGGGTHDNSNAGGLIGGGSGTVTDSYWDTVTSGITAAGSGTGKTTTELKAQAAYTGIYVDWDVDYDNADGDDSHDTGRDLPWFFGAANDYPRLTYAAPLITGVGVADSGALGAGDKVTVTVNFDKRVEVSGSPSLAIAIGGEARPAVHAFTASNALRSPTTLRFAYTVVRGDNGAVTVPDGSIALGENGTITDLSGVNAPASLAFEGASVLAGLNAMTVPPDTTAPSVRYKPPASLTVGQRIRAIVPDHQRHGHTLLRAQGRLRPAAHPAPGPGHRQDHGPAYEGDRSEHHGHHPRLRRRAQLRRKSR